jgi:hypothetical protein
LRSALDFGLTSTFLGHAPWNAESLIVWGKDKCNQEIAKKGALIRGSRTPTAIS